MIYTSGSTGTPKGAANTHAGLHNRLAWMQDAYGLTGDDVVLQKTPFSFDVSVREFFWPLIVGARLVMAAPGAHRDPARLVETIRRDGVTTLHFVPSMQATPTLWQTLLAEGGEHLPDLKGLAMLTAAARRCRRNCGIGSLNICRRFSWRTCTARPRPRSP